MSERVMRWSSSVSPENPAMMSVVMAQSGMWRRMAAMRSRYHSRVYLRFMRSSIALDPDWAGRCMARQMLGIEAIVSNRRSLMSLGCEVAKRTRSSGDISATLRSSAGKSTSPVR